MSVEIKLSRAISACLWLLFAIPALCFAQNTSFTYQGRLNQQGTPANGVYNLRFALCTNAAGASPAAAVLTNGGVLVSNGLFTTTLDFGNVFDGRAYWLELGVRTNTSPTDFTVLTPRQALTAVPYAIQAANATTVIGPIPDALLSTNIPRLNGVSAAIDWTNIGGRPNSPVELLSATHIAPTTSSIYHGSNPGYWLNLGAGTSGMLRQIEFTSPPGSNNWRVYLTNFYLRVYVDAGTITNLAALPAGSLLVNAPLAVLFGSKYRPAAPSFVQATGSRYLGLNENWFSSNAIGSFTFNLNLPMPFANGVLVGLFDANANTLSPWGYSYVSYEPGQLPAELVGWRLHSGRATGSYSDNANITFLNATNAGELVSIYASFHHSNNDRTFLEGIWYIQSDGSQAPLGCAGGEDMFNNGYYFSFGPQVTYNYGTIHIETPFAVEAYRHFSAADAFFWRSSATAFFQPWSTAGVPLDADILCFYYSK